jgi:hypothetical protein
VKSVALLLTLALTAAACGGSGGVEDFPELPADHLGAGDPLPTYNSDPPTSGPHAPTWSRCGIYQTPIPDVVQVHDLEHGTIVVQYDPAIGEDDLESLIALARGLDGHMLVAPRPGLTDLVVATAWTHMQRFSTVDVDALREFWLAFAQQGPEVEACPFDGDIRFADEAPPP